jgi:hypothetical protein
VRQTRCRLRDRRGCGHCCRVCRRRVCSGARGLARQTLDRVCRCSSGRVRRHKTAFCSSLYSICRAIDAEGKMRQTCLTLTGIRPLCFQQRDTWHDEEASDARVSVCRVVDRRVLSPPTELQTASSWEGTL